MVEQLLFCHVNGCEPVRVCWSLRCLWYFQYVLCLCVWKEVLWRLMLFFVVVCWEGWIFKLIVGHPTIPGVTRSSWNFQTSHWTTLPETNSKSTCKWWLEDDRFLLGWVDEQPIFRCELLLCSGRDTYTVQLAFQHLIMSNTPYTGSQISRGNFHCLVCGFKYFLFSTLPGERIQFD